MKKEKMKKENELNACKAFLGILARLTGTTYVIESSPDEGMSKEGEGEPDFILKSTRAGMTKVAVEHTAIALFYGQQGYATSSYNRAERIDRLCRGRIPEDRYYYITAPHMLISSLTDKRRQEAFDVSLADWIAQEAPQLQIDDARQHRYECYDVTLTCGGTHPKLNGRVWRIQEYPKDAAKLQREAFDRAIKHGLAKLTKYKRNPSESFTTALLLEDVAGLMHERITKGLTYPKKIEIGNFIDYIIVFQSNNNQMIVGYVWEEKEKWHSFIPADRRFNLRSQA